MGFPLITQAPQTKVVEMGHNTVLACTAVGSPAPIISWVRDMMPIDTSNPRYTVLDTGKSNHEIFHVPFEIRRGNAATAGLLTRRRVKRMGIWGG